MLNREIVSITKLVMPRLVWNISGLDPFTFYTRFFSDVPLKTFGKITITFSLPYFAFKIQQNVRNRLIIVFLNKKSWSEYTALSSDVKLSTFSVWKSKLSSKFEASNRNKTHEALCDYPNRGAGVGVVHLRRQISGFKSYDACWEFAEFGCLYKLVGIGFNRFIEVNLKELFVS